MQGTDWLIAVVFVVGLLGGIGAAIGSIKGRTAAGFWLGALLGPLGWLIAAVLGRSEGATVACPKCAERIQPAATVCRWCGATVGA